MEVVNFQAKSWSYLIAQSIHLGKDVRQREVSDDQNAVPTELKLETAGLVLEQ